MGIVLKEIIKKYPVGNGGKEQVVLNGLSLSVQDGEIVAIKGKSGAGKSTLLHIMGLLDVMDSGSYLLDDIDVSCLGNKEMAKMRNKKIGFVLQDYGLVEDETVLYNVELPLMFSSAKLRKIQSAARKTLRKIGVENLCDKKVSVLSGGEKQRVAIARALVSEPNYIMADEPTGALDSKMGNEILKFFKQLNKEMGITIVMITHEFDIAKYASRLIHIRDGHINYDGPMPKTDRNL